MEGGAGEERLERRVHDRCAVRAVPEGPGQPGVDDVDRAGAGMSTTEEDKTVDKAQYIICDVLVAVGAFLIYDALSLTAGFAKVDPVGPRLFPISIGVALIVLAIILAIGIPRGVKGEAEIGEDIYPNVPSDWRTVGLLVGLFVVTIVL